MKHFGNRAFVVASLVLSAALVFAQGGAGGQGRGGAGGAGGGQGRGGGQFGQRGGQFGQGGNLVQIALRADVQKDLAVTPEQKTKLEEYSATQRGGRGGGGAGGAGGGVRGAGGAGGAGGGAGGAGGGGGQGRGGAGGVGGGQGRGGAGGGNFDPAAAAQRAEEQRAAQLKALGEILNAGQVTRLQEIAIQLQGSRALMNPTVQKELGLTPEQITKIQDLNQKQGEANRTIQEKVRNQEISQEEAQASREKNNKILDEELNKVLNAGQAAKFKSMQGKPFAADPNLARGGRGGGGGGL